mmetsp:Transcript_9847/g.22021  ORF Transcript_9847/g.22021 Transcript_9847/m.22021 type:complete len:222 (+) Transcript_9847:1090-1755(+)
MAQPCCMRTPVNAILCFNRSMASRVAFSSLIHLIMLMCFVCSMLAALFMCFICMLPVLFLSWRSFSVLMMALSLLRCFSMALLINSMALLVLAIVLVLLFLMAFATLAIVNIVFAVLIRIVLRLLICCTWRLPIHLDGVGTCLAIGCLFCVATAMLLSPSSSSTPVIFLFAFSSSPAATTIAFAISPLAATFLFAFSLSFWLLVAVPFTSIFAFLVSELNA